MCKLLSQKIPSLHQRYVWQGCLRIVHVPYLSYLIPVEKRHRYTRMPTADWSYETLHMQVEKCSFIPKPSFQLPAFFEPRAIDVVYTMEGHTVNQSASRAKCTLLRKQSMAKHALGNCLCGPMRGWERWLKTQWVSGILIRKNRHIRCIPQEGGKNANLQKRKNTATASWSALLPPLMWSFLIALLRLMLLKRVHHYALKCIRAQLHRKQPSKAIEKPGRRIWNTTNDKNLDWHLKRFLAQALWRPSELKQPKWYSLLPYVSGILYGHFLALCYDNDAAMKTAFSWRSTSAPSKCVGRSNGNIKLLVIL